LLGKCKTSKITKVRYPANSFQEIGFMQLKRIMQSLEQIICMGEKLLTTFDVEELLDGLVGNICALLEAEGATLYLIDPMDGTLVSQSIQSEDVKEISLTIDNRSIAGHTAIIRKPLHIEDAYGDLSGIHPDLSFNKKFDEQTGRRTRNVITCPLIIHDDLIGVFQVLNKKIGSFSEDDQMILRNFCLVAGVAIMNARLMERVLEAQAINSNVLNNISDLVMVQNKAGMILHLNDSATKYLHNKGNGKNYIGHNFTEVFPELTSLAPEIVFDHQLDKVVSNDVPSYVILSQKNFRHQVEKVVVIIRKIDSKETLKP
jgi:adenylate cyclase